MREHHLAQHFLPFAAFGMVALMVLVGISQVDNPQPNVSAMSASKSIGILPRTPPLGFGNTQIPSKRKPITAPALGVKPETTLSPKAPGVRFFGNDRKHGSLTVTHATAAPSEFPFDSELPVMSEFHTRTLEASDELPPQDVYREKEPDHVPGSVELMVYGTTKVGLKFGVTAAAGPEKPMEDSWAVHQNMHRLPASTIPLTMISPDHMLMTMLRPSTREFAIPGTDMFSVFDGHGGWEAAAFVSKFLPFAVRTHPSFSANFLVAIREAHHIVDNQYFGHMLEENIPRGVGATGVTVFIREGMLYCANVGNAKAVVLRQRGTLELDEKSDMIRKVEGKFEVVELARQHYASQTPEFNEQIKELDSMKEEFASAANEPASAGCSTTVSRGFGNFACKPTLSADPEISQIEISPSDRYLVLATAGLWDVVSSSEVGGVAKSRAVVPHAFGIASGLMALARNRNTSQDTTIVVVDLMALTRESLYGGAHSKRHMHYASGVFGSSLPL